MGEAESLAFRGRLFGEALRNTVVTMAGITLDWAQEENQPEHIFQTETVTGMMVLAGAYPAVLFLSASRNALAEMVMYMTGIDSSEMTDRDLDDGIGELVNMVAGSVKTQLKGSEVAFQLTSPFVFRGKGEVISKPTVSGYLASFEAAQIQILLKIVYI